MNNPYVILKCPCCLKHIRYYFKEGAVWHQTVSDTYAPILDINDFKEVKTNDGYVVNNSFRVEEKDF